MSRIDGLIIAGNCTCDDDDGEDADTMKMISDSIQTNNSDNNGSDNNHHDDNESNNIVHDNGNEQ